MFARLSLLILFALSLSACSPPAARKMTRAQVCELAAQRRAEWRNIDGSSIYSNSAAFRRAHLSEIAELEGHCRAAPASRGRL
ncbi:hypothetical protein [Falsigemmobacter faecalis]|uniref:Uncharacterized protein n=1 Tax=Falsigemmobacter faecalis TaxID=2488730 RepID=A0A3P3D6F8_9RHOB|nr:hypothetical protein [Falsigemmobacter faecalis]RRH69404.1 hypothetical protein EG244_18255 [Falsigemmobacter faecalis]